jgi:putative transposase
VFSQLMKPLDRRILNRIVASHDGDHGVGSGPNAWTCIRHFRAMLFAQLAGLNSLREIVHGLAADPGGLYHLDLRAPRRSTLGDAQANRPAAVFRDICGMLIGEASRAVRQDGKELIQLIDASPIPLRDPRFDWAEADARTRGLKLHVGYDPRGDVIDQVGTVRISVCGRAIEHYAAMALMKRSPKMTAN